ncbi:MAG TPA: malate synthase G [Woeseiaceae bacterium]|nr:malate synthase G [Woeseiaceae bacterium]
MSPESTREHRAGLSIDARFFRFIEDELLPGINLDSSDFWQGVAGIVKELTPINRDLLAHRDELQQQIDAWHAGRGPSWDHGEYLAFLKSIGYLEDAPAPFQISTQNVDPEIATIAGPQLVVPVNNARFALNACNARWGSLYDALYGTDVIDEKDGKERSGSYNPGRGAAVISYAAGFLDRSCPLHAASHADVAAYAIVDGKPARFVATLRDGREVSLRRPEQFVAYRSGATQQAYLLQNHGLHVELQIDPTHPVGRTAGANLADVVLEAAVTTIQDCEDSVAAVDAADKVLVYRNWLGLMQGDLETRFEKNGKRCKRTLNADRAYTGADGGEYVLPGRSLMLVRNVGHLMTNSAVQDADGKNVFEGMLDAIVTTACAIAKRKSTGSLPNSRTGSVYIVKPKMHGVGEAIFTSRMFGMVEDVLDLPQNTIKVGVMDEERRTTVNLAACIHAVRERIVFINTGFLDRTGDEIHTSMQAGPVLRKEAIKEQPWIAAYEDWNVDIGIRCGLPGKAQIGKGMWPKPDEMKQMMDSKQAHPEAGANCAWVPSPTAATLHAMHYHAVDVQARQAELAKRPLASLDAILTPPLGDPSGLSASEVQSELDNNVQGILGYVVRWIDQGIGCSKVPDINHVGLMEDRATLRISSQHIANWLLHGVTTREQVAATFERMAKVVDDQNAADPNYQPMCPHVTSSIAYRAACDLVFKGINQPNGYTEPLLHEYRLRLKST